MFGFQGASSVFRVPYPQGLSPGNRQTPFRRSRGFCWLRTQVTLRFSAYVFLVLSPTPLPRLFVGLGLESHSAFRLTCFSSFRQRRSRGFCWPRTRVTLRFSAYVFLVLSPTPFSRLFVGLGLESHSAFRLTCFSSFRQRRSHGHRSRGLVGSSGLEPPTSRLSGVRSNRLSYEPIYAVSLFVARFPYPPGGDDEVRTHDPLRARQVLSQLSYTPVSRIFFRPSKLNNIASLLPFTSHRPSSRLPLSFFLRKEVIQPHLPIRLPCYDFTPITGFTFGRAPLAVRLRTSGTPGSHGVTGGVYKARERIHRGMLIRDY